ncbi:unnamed protein product [Adineta steineri]|uniref:Uncharacterized protein n=1 Tax=Adineta steineri TaxID=433720 RepID=A0A814QVI8_9BILA|nr:unnamed protein product [Adineta steineri]
MVHCFVLKYCIYQKTIIFFFCTDSGITASLVPTLNLTHLFQTLCYEKYQYCIRNLHDDGFAIGPMKLMYYFMTRWYTLRNCPPDIDYQPGKYLKKHLSRFMNVTVDKDMTGAADAIQHGPNKCH